MHSHRFGVVPIWEPWQVWDVRKGPPKYSSDHLEHTKNLSSAVPELWFCSSGGVCVRMRVCSEALYL